MPRVELGNTAPIQPIKLSEDETAVVREPLEGVDRTETVFHLPDEWDFANMIDTVRKVYASHHSDDHPAWVESDDDVLAQALSRDFGCPIGRPADWNGDDYGSDD